VTLPADSHVHSEWSWDAPRGSMERSCAQAVAIGLPAIAFTEHFDHTVWKIDLAGPHADSHLAALTTADGHLTPPAFDPDGYSETIERCRHRFPHLRILSGLEIGEPHWHAEAATKMLGTGLFDRVIGSLHCLPDGDGYAEPPGLFAHHPAADILRDYLAEVARLVRGSDAFSVLAHIDYPLRYWPEREAGRFVLSVFEDDFRNALRATAHSGRALEINTRLPLHPTILSWWREEGGQAVTFGSDAHEPSAIARGFREAADLAEAKGFRPGRNPYDFWSRVN
jgi:histidinol-phosphatase (PHP family)